MKYPEILVEGSSDMPAVKEILGRKFHLSEKTHYQIHPHRGKGKLPTNPLARPDPRNRQLLDQLPAKLRGYGKSLTPEYCVVVLLDADDDHCLMLKKQLIDLYDALDSKPLHVLFRIAVEETESWFIADHQAVKNAYSNAHLNKIRGIEPDAVCGAWGRLAEALGRKPAECTGANKVEWAEKIVPHLNLDAPYSPSLRVFLQGIEDLAKRPQA